MLRKILTKTEVKKNLTISVIGTGLGQLIHLGATPILSRIYTPELFGQYALFVSFIGIFTSLSLMKFELAIISCEDKEVPLLSKLISKIGWAITALACFVAFTLWFSKNSNLKIFLFLIIIIPILNKYWTTRAILNRAKKFKALSLGKIFENSTIAITSIGLGFLNLKEYGLFVGKILGHAITWIYFKLSGKNLYQEQSEINTKELIDKYKNFPKYSFPAEIVGQLNFNSSIFLFTYFFSSIEVGLIGLTTRVLSVPANFVSISFFDVFKQKAVEDFKKSGEFKTIFKKFFFSLLTIATLMVLFIYFTGPVLFSWFLGNKWEKAGEYAKYLSLIYAIRLIAGPLTYSLEIKNKHYINLIFQCLYLVIGVSSILITYYLTSNDLYCVMTYSFSLSSLYLIHILLAYLNSHKDY